MTSFVSPHSVQSEVKSNSNQNEQPSNSAPELKSVQTEPRECDLPSPLKFYFSCKFCAVHSVDRNKVIQHIKDQHKFDTVTVDHYTPGYLPKKLFSLVSETQMSSKSPVTFEEEMKEQYVYECIYCSKFYTTKPNVRKHIKKVHCHE